MIRTRPTIWDAVAIILVLAMALLLLLPPLFQETGSTLLITTSNGEFTYDLSVDREVSIVSNGITLLVRIENGTASVRHSDCPDGICRTSAAISNSGQTILCAPAGVRLTVRGGADDVDFVAG